MTSNTREMPMGAVAEMEENRKADNGKGQTFFEWAGRVGRRNWIIAGAVALIGLAVGLNLIFFSDSTQTGGYADYDQSAGMSSDAGTNGDSTTNSTTADYFATVQVNRQRARDESMEVLQNVIDSADSTEAVKNEALAEMNTIAMEIEKEANIEALLVSKGFADCVAVMNGNSINVVVQSEGELLPAQIAQINTVVYEQTGIEPLNVTIVHKN